MNKRALYESIMKSVAKEVKKALNETSLRNKKSKYTLNESLLDDDIYEKLKKVCHDCGPDAKIDGDTVHVWLCWHSNMDVELYDTMMEASGWLENFALENDLEYVDGDQDFDKAYDIVWRVEIPRESFDACYEDLLETAEHIRKEVKEGYDNH